MGLVESDPTPLRTLFSDFSATITPLVEAGCTLLAFSSHAIANAAFSLYPAKSIMFRYDITF
jgi:hypothetical protein